MDTIKAPTSGVCRQVWKTLDRIQKRNPRPTARDIRRVASRRGWNETTATVQLYRWRKAHGIEGRV